MAVQNNVKLYMQNKRNYPKFKLPGCTNYVKIMPHYFPRGGIVSNFMCPYLNLQHISKIPR